MTGYEILLCGVIMTLIFIIFIRSTYALDQEIEEAGKKWLKSLEGLSTEEFYVAIQRFKDKGGLK
jgi:hypothetical protein